MLAQAPPRRPQHEAPPAAPSTAPSPPAAAAAYHHTVSHHVVAVALLSSPWIDPRRRPTPSPAAGGLPVLRRLPRRRCDVVRSSHRIPVLLQILPLPAFLVAKICHLPPAAYLVSSPTMCSFLHAAVRRPPSRSLKVLHHHSPPPPPLTPAARHHRQYSCTRPRTTTSDPPQ